MELLPDEPLKNKLIRNGFRLYFFQFLIAPAGYLIKMMVSRELSVEDIGLFYSLLGLISIISLYNDFGLTEALQYYLPHYFIDKKYREAKTIIVFTWLIQFASGILVSGTLFFGAERIAGRYFKNLSMAPLLQYFSFYFLIINLFQVIGSIFSAVQYIKRQQAIEAIRIWSVVILTALSFYRRTLDLIHFTQRWLCGVIIALIVALLGLYKEFNRLFRDYHLSRDRHLITQQRRYGLWILLGTGAGTLLVQINQQFALYTLGAKAAGYRSNYISFYTIINVIIGPIIGYLFPLLNELYKKGDKEKIALLYRYLFIGVVIIGVVGGILAYFLSPWVAVMLFGENFRESGVLFTHYAPFLITIPLIGILFQDIASRGMVKQRVYAIAGALVANFLASIVLEKYFGLTGLVYAQLIGNLVLVGCGAYRYNRSHQQ